ncbi:hypothetical protein FRB91_001952 [Serendipita sp. 411]|nr:hypothetical protein FRB91_001952 [Serendipita sp. 411]
MQQPGQDQGSLAVPAAAAGSSSEPGGVHSQDASEEGQEDEEGNAHSRGGIPQVTRDALKEACKAIKEEIFPVNTAWQLEFGTDSYLNECGITERAVLAMLKHKAAGVTLVSQRQEGRMGCDLIVQMLVPAEIQKKGMENHLSNKVDKATINSAESPRKIPEAVRGSERIKTGRTPNISGTPTGANTPSRAKGTQTQGKVKSPVVPHLTDTEIPPGFTFLTVYLQAKWYKQQNKRNNDGTPIRTKLKSGEVREKEFSADFTYIATGAKTTQLELLNMYVEKRKKINPKTTGGYLLYGGEKQDVTFALLDDVLSECRKHNGQRPCNEHESEINILMSRRFHEEGKSQECFLEHIAETAGLFT